MKDLFSTNQWLGQALAFVVLTLCVVILLAFLEAKPETIKILGGATLFNALLCFVMAWVATEKEE